MQSGEMFVCCATGNAIQTVKSVDAVKLITVRSTAFEAAAVGAGTAATESGYTLPLYQQSVFTFACIVDSTCMVRKKIPLLIVK